MVVANSSPAPVNNDRILGDADALIASAQRSFTAAAKAIAAENDRPGIPMHGATGAKSVVRHPAQSVDRR